MNSDLRIPVLSDRHTDKMKMNEEDLKIPFKKYPCGKQPGCREDTSSSCEKRIIPPFILSGMLFLFYYTLSNCADVADHMTSVKPAIDFESVYVCPITIPYKADFWVFTFNITNLNNYTDLCIDQSEASLFSSFNRTHDLLAKGGDLHQTCVEPLSHTSMNVTFIAVEPSNQSDWGNYGSLHLFDLKLRSRFNHIYRQEATHSKIGEVVCRDAKLAFSTTSSSNSSSSSCGAMTGDPPQCSFESYYEY